MTNVEEPESRRGYAAAIAFLLSLIPSPWGILRFVSPGSAGVDEALFAAWLVFLMLAVVFAVRSLIHRAPRAPLNIAVLIVSALALYGFGTFFLGVMPLR